MVFSSTLFLFCFLPFTLIVYYLLDIKYRNVFLLLASLFFYAWGEPRFVIIMIASILINYFCGLLIAYVKTRNKLLINRLVLILTVVLNLSFLFYFKYYNFFISTVDNILGLSISLKNIVLPIGISFFTFQGMSYTLDLYLGKTQLQKNPINIALYISLFPQLIAGPIVRYSDVNQQITGRVCSVDKFAEGVRRFVIGLSKKVIIANQLGYVADQVFSLPANQNSVATAWAGIICYTFQIYFDFSGYSDMAIGLGKMFGFSFLENFNYPYISKSIREFWRRWHISLSSWFKDYVYIPLGGNKKGNVYNNLLIVFFVTGLWHGAAWNFVVWGLWHGMFLIIERVLAGKNKKISLPSPVKLFYTIFVVVIGWVLFRSPDLKYAVEYLGIMFGVVKPVNVGFTVFWYLDRKVITILCVAVLTSIDWKSVFSERIKFMENKWSYIFAGNMSIIFLLLISIMMVVTSTYNPFIYFRF